MNIGQAIGEWMRILFSFTHEELEKINRDIHELAQLLKLTRDKPDNMHFYAMECKLKNLLVSLNEESEDLASADPS